MNSNNIEIIADTKDYLVINKPAGLLVHGAPHIKEATLVNWLLQEYPEVGQIGEDLDRPGIMHRLDKDVSGLMVIAKNHASYEALKEQFKNRTITKEYTALVYGKVLKDEGEIDFPIKRSTKGYKMAAVPQNFSEENEDEKIRLAATTFSVIKRFINFTLLKVIIKTGRTHQIRVHLHAYGYPLVGDNLYNNKQSKIKNKKYNLGRVFLASTRLEFNDLDGIRQNFSLGLPEDLNQFLTQIK
jgi:23S rRNA pseudouridine1911/1915/1917 synthase